jgi:hypothetical protein
MFNNFVVGYSHCGKHIGKKISQLIAQLTTVVEILGKNLADRDYLKYLKFVGPV